MKFGTHFAQSGARNGCKSAVFCQKGKKNALFLLKLFKKFGQFK
jgi:hypothetical protein